MSRRYPGAGARSGPHVGSGVARHRWAASLGTAAEEGLLGVTPVRGAPANRSPADGSPDGAASGGAPDRPSPDRPSPDGPSPDGASAAESPVPVVFRWRSGRSAAALLAVISVLLAGWFWWQAADGAPMVQPLGEPPGAEAADGSGPAGADDAAPGGATAAADPGAAEVPGATAAGTIVVHVAGAVARAGVVQLPRGSRIHEAINAAGGSTRAADLDRLNLAAVLEDGQKVLVPERGSPDPVELSGPSTGTGGTGTSGGAGAPAGKVNLNTAGVEELATLPRVGPVLAQRIVDWRKQHGSFGSVEELDAVEGVGPKLLEALLPLVRV